MSQKPCIFTSKPTQLPPAASDMLALDPCGCVSLYTIGWDGSKWALELWLCLFPDDLASHSCVWTSTLELLLFPWTLSFSWRPTIRMIIWLRGQGIVCSSHCTKQVSKPQTYFAGPQSPMEGVTHSNLLWALMTLLVRRSARLLATFLLSLCRTCHLFAICVHSSILQGWPHPRTHICFWISDY